jgi:hypothetical protein
MQIHCTKKLFEKLPASLTEQSPSAQPIGVYANWLNWHANVVVMQRRQNLIFVNDATRFAVFIPVVVQKDFANLPHLFTDVFINTLLKSDIDFELVDKAAKLIQQQPFSFNTVCDRSVQGTMRLMASDIEYELIYDGSKITDLLPYSTSARLSERPCKIKGKKGVLWPNRMMAELLISLS